MMNGINIECLYVPLFKESAHRLIVPLLHALHKYLAPC